ncbi:MAG: PD-(D/E)XK nuclease family protein [Gammaproteobacteria bacterium]|nr:PD-(D/E)XK nuclease family protein [Gammaproteobacteria bacterium]
MIAGKQVLTHAEWHTRLQQFFSPLAAKVRIYCVPDNFTRYIETDLQPSFKPAQTVQHRLSADELISYTSLVHTLESAEEDFGGREDEPISATPLPPKMEPGLWSASFKGGKQAGSFIHNLLEHMMEDPGFYLNSLDPQSPWEQTCAHWGYAQDSAYLRAWLQKCLNQRLPIIQESLGQVAPFATEMPFNFTTQISVPALDQWCKNHIWPEHSRNTLPSRQIRGMLKGVIDLVFTSANQYWVLDYKSNFLGHDEADYDFNSLQQTVLQHRYELQISLYMLALHRLLKLRLGEHYQPIRQLGGAILYFLRGVDAPSCGVIQVPLNIASLEQLDQLLGKSI